MEMAKPSPYFRTSFMRPSYSCPKTTQNGDGRGKTPPSSTAPHVPTRADVFRVGYNFGVGITNPPSECLVSTLPLKTSYSKWSFAEDFELIPGTQVLKCSPN